MKTMKAAALLLMAAPSAGHASDWTYSATAYGWLAGLSSSNQTPSGTVETELSFSDIIDSVDVALYGTFEARRGQWGLITDIAYTDLSTTENVAATTNFNNAAIGSKLTLVSTYAAYRAVEAQETAFDLFGGLRYNKLELDGNFTGGTAAPFQFASSDDWVDPIIGARFSAAISDRWTASAFFDVGGFGIGDASDLTWQLAATARYSLNDRWSLVAGYRHFFVDQSVDGIDTELEVSGPIVGVNLRF